MKMEIFTCLSKACLIAALAWSASPAAADETLPAVDLKLAFPNLKIKRPMWLEEAPDGSQRLFIVEQAGKVLILPKDRNGADTVEFLDITRREPMVFNEEGLLGFTFHPQFKANGKFYLFYSLQNPRRSVISEMRVLQIDPNKADAATERVVLEIPRPYWNHDGGALIFGPDGYLYFSVGDGGTVMGDPHNLGQNLNSFQAKVHRIDVNRRDAGRQYAIPSDNPFVGKGGGVREETWAYGLRNIWRMSFDRETGELWAGDVGQAKWEEVDLVVKGGNYGWSAQEGFHPHKETPLNGKPLEPVIEYGHNPQLCAESKFPDHSQGVSITGGYVYRGKKLPKLRGVYVYADYQLGTILGLRQEAGKVLTHGTLVKQNPARNIASFGEDRAGELYVLAFDGKIYEFTGPLAGGR